MITAFHDMDTTLRAIKLGATEYIAKPIDVDELEKAVPPGHAADQHPAGEPALARPLPVSYRKGTIVAGTSKEIKENLQDHRRPFRKPRHRPHERARQRQARS